VNDGICSAIEAGEKVLKTVTKETFKKKPLEGPTIELLVDNEDVFSLICMLCAQNEKRLAAALAVTTRFPAKARWTHCYCCIEIV
jgi:hypothetical protein